MASKIVILEKTVTWFDKNIKSIEIREPTCAEFIDIGEPKIWARSADGGIFAIEQSAAVKMFLDRCLNVENGSAIFSLLSLKDGQALKGALFGVFTDAAAPQTSNSDGDSSSLT
jgi:hypothetical protein